MPFQSPNYTQTPNDFFDMLPGMEETEVKVTLVMIRQTFGFHRDGFKMGINKLADAAGLSRNGAKLGAERAEQRGTFKRTNPDSQGEAEWSLVVSPPPSDQVGGQRLTTPPATVDQQVGVKERIKKQNKKGVFLSEKEVEQANRKVDAIISNSRNGLFWDGRETFHPDHFLYVDWYHKITGQVCSKSKRKDWHMAVMNWAANGLTIEHLQAAYDMDVKWRGVFTSPNQLTDKAIALKAKNQTTSQQEAPDRFAGLMAMLEDQHENNR